MIQTKTGKGLGWEIYKNYDVIAISTGELCGEYYRRGGYHESISFDIILVEQFKDGIHVLTHFGTSAKIFGHFEKKLNEIDNLINKQFIAKLKAADTLTERNAIKDTNEDAEGTKYVWYLLETDEARKMGF